MLQLCTRWAGWGRSGKAIAQARKGTTEIATTVMQMSVLKHWSGSVKGVAFSHPAAGSRPRAHLGHCQPLQPHAWARCYLHSVPRVHIVFLLARAPCCQCSLVERWWGEEAQEQQSFFISQPHCLCRSPWALKEQCFHQLQLFARAVGGRARQGAPREALGCLAFQHNNHIVYALAAHTIISRIISLVDCRGVRRREGQARRCWEASSAHLNCE
jgi:hypothetical protein